MRSVLLAAAPGGAIRSLIIRETKLNSVIWYFSKVFCDISKVPSFIVAFESNTQKELDKLVEHAGNDGDQIASVSEWSLSLENYGTASECDPIPAGNDNWIHLAVPCANVLSRLGRSLRECGRDTPAGSHTGRGENASKRNLF